MLGRAYREQQNREAVAEKTLEYLNDDPPPQDSPGPTDEFMDMFENYASRASSEGVRDMFSRILAGEIRKPGNFSTQTIHFVSVLDHRTATIIENILPYIWLKDFIPKECLPNSVPFGIVLQLENAGFLSTGGGMLSNEIKLSDGCAVLFQGNVGVIGKFESQKKESIKMSGYVLSNSAKELVAVLGSNPDIMAASSALRKAGAKEVFRGYPIYSGQNVVKLQFGEAIPEESPNCG